MRSIIKAVLAITAAVIIAAATTGCASIQESVAAVQNARDEAAQLKLAVDDELAAVSAQRAAVDATSEAAPALDAAIARLHAKSAALGAAIVHADQTIENAQNPSDPLSLGVKALAPLIPAPIQAPLVLGAALAATLVRSGALKKSAVSIVESIDHAKRKDADFRAAMDRHADAIRTIQTPGARKLVKKSGA